METKKKQSTPTYCFIGTVIKKKPNHFVKNGIKNIQFLNIDLHRVASYLFFK